MFIILVACHSAGISAGYGLKAVGPQLARAGVPSVLGFQGAVTTRTIRKMLPRFFAELRRDGVIDRSLAVARAELREDAWWQPVLWQGISDVRLQGRASATPNGDARLEESQRRPAPSAAISVPPSSDIARIYEALDLLDDAEFDRLCTSAFPEVVRKFSPGQGLDQRNNILVTHCIRKQKLSALADQLGITP